MSVETPALTQMEHVGLLVGAKTAAPVLHHITE